MSRRLFRLAGLRGFLPRVSAPLLPVSRLRTTPTQSPLTHSARLPHLRTGSSGSVRLSSSSASSSSSSSSALPKDASLSQRLKHLIKSYGWYALGVYVVLSTLDFTVAFAAINLLGAEQVSRVAASVKEAVAGLIHSKPPEPGRDEIDPVTGNPGAGNGGLYAMLVLAYTVHKTLFLPVRVGLTAWLTPRLVNWLRARGWAGGEGTRRAAAEMREKLRQQSRR
jgi:N-terminal acetyltransferase 2